MNAVMVETWVYFKLSYSSIAKDTFKKTHLLPLYPTDQDTHSKALLVDNQMAKEQKAEEKYFIENSIIVPKYIEEISIYDPMVILRYKGGIRFPYHLLFSVSYYGTIRTCDVLLII